MQKVSIETTQNVNIEYQIASLGDRIAALLIDTAVKIAYALVGILIMTGISNGLNEAENIVFVIIFFLPILFYHLISEIMMDGQSIGKRQMKIKVVKLDGSQASLGAYIIRWIMRLIDQLFYYGVALLTILLNKKGQRLGDIVAGTTVIKLNKEVNLSYHSHIDSPEPEYQPTFLQATKLSDKDIEIIKQALDFYRDTGNPEPMEATVKKTKELLNIESDLPPARLLNMIIKDYNFLAARIPQ